MNPPPSRSRFRRWVTRSWLYRRATRPPLPPRSMLEQALLVRALRALPAGYQTVLAMGGAVVLAGVLLKSWVAALMGLVFVLAAAFPVPALLLVPLLFLWIPRVHVAVVGDEALFLRLDLAAVAGMLAYVTSHSKGGLRTPPAHTPFLLFLLVIIASILLGLVRGTLATPVSSLLYLGQWLELYAVYVSAWSLGPRLRGLAAYAWAVPLFALVGYGLAEYVWPYPEAPEIRYRTFERGLFPGQANHAAGLFAFATATAIAMATTRRHRVLGIALAMLATIALWPTGSRSGVVAWAAGLGALVLVYAPAMRWWLPPVGLVGLAAIPASWWQRVSAPGSSMYDRLVAWKSALSTVDAYPLFGLGAGARHRSYYDNHYVMTLSESGLTGLVLFALLLITLGHALAHGCRGNRPGVWWCAGALAGLGALSVHALATATFIVTLVAGPFFWYCGVALAQAERRS